jgi:hypothetical protein
VQRGVSKFLTLLVAAIGVSQLGLECGGGGVGDPCIPEDEYRTSFQGFGETEVNVESRSFQCETRVCLVANFRGRVSCPYGQAALESDPGVVDPAIGQAQCRIPGTKGTNANELISVPVEAQLIERRPDDAVYCSCRCDGADSNARYCECPSGFECRELIQDLGLGSEQLAGSYCIREGTFVPNPQTLRGRQTCSAASRNCGPVHPASQ